MREYELLDQCAVISTLKLFSAKWKPCILSQLMVKERRYSKLFRLIPNISKKMLTEHLRDLKNDGLIRREIFPSIPPQVTYYITLKGKSLEIIFKTLSDWGIKNFNNVGSMEEMIAKTNQL